MSSSFTDPAVNSTNVTLDSVFQNMEHWRTHKHQYPNNAVPDALWHQIFTLAEVHPVSRLIKIFALNSTQYKSKFRELIGPGDASGAQADNETLPTAGFCEVNASNSASAAPLTAPPHETKESLAQLKSNNSDLKSYLDLSTIIVECIRPDGQRLKIHTTTKKLQEVMQAFFTSGGAGV